MKRGYKIALVVIAAVVLFGGLGLYISNPFRNLSPIQNGTGVGHVSLSGRLIQSSVLEYDNSRDFLAYSLVSYSATNASVANVSLEIYAKNPVERIYLLNVTGFCVS